MRPKNNIRQLLDRHHRSNRNKLAGYSRSEFKTLLKRAGFKVNRSFGLIHTVMRDNRLYRFRWWADEGFMVDISDPLEHFDRWANSTERVVPFSSMFPVRKPVYRTKREKLWAAQRALAGADDR